MGMLLTDFGTTILHYDGTAWSIMKNPVSNTSLNLHGVWGSSATSVLAVGEAGTLLQFDSDGDDVPDYEDNCPNICNITQLDADNDTAEMFVTQPRVAEDVLEYSANRNASPRILTVMASQTSGIIAPLFQIQPRLIQITIALETLVMIVLMTPQMI